MDDWKEYNYRSDYLRMVELQIQEYRKKLKAMAFKINAIIELISKHASDDLVDDLYAFLEEE
tara:strand:- start:45 stop:230 length:186 start_codon:yes stop_codon:yes gene_type:complete